MLQHCQDGSTKAGDRGTSRAHCLEKRAQRLDLGKKKKLFLHTPSWKSSRTALGLVLSPSPEFQQPWWWADPPGPCAQEILNPTPGAPNILHQLQTQD